MIPECNQRKDGAFLGI